MKITKAEQKIIKFIQYFTKKTFHGVTQEEARVFIEKNISVANKNRRKHCAI